MEPAGILRHGGGLHAFYRIIEDTFVKLSDKRRKRASCFAKKIGKIAVTFAAVDFAWIFFASNSFRAAIEIIQQMFSKIYTSGILDIGLNRTNWFLLISGIGVMTVVDILHEKDISVFGLVNRQRVWVRWILYLGLIWSTIMFGIYGVSYDASQFIYFQF